MQTFRKINWTAEKDNQIIQGVHPVSDSCSLAYSPMSVSMNSSLINSILEYANTIKYKRKIYRCSLYFAGHATMSSLDGN